VRSRRHANSWVSSDLDRARHSAAARTPVSHSHTIQRSLKLWFNVSSTELKRVITFCCTTCYGATDVLTVTNLLWIVYCSLYFYLYRIHIVQYTLSGLMTKKTQPQCNHDANYWPYPSQMISLYWRPADATLVSSFRASVLSDSFACFTLNISTTVSTPPTSRNSSRNWWLRQFHTIAAWTWTPPVRAKLLFSYRAYACVDACHIQAKTRAWISTFWDGQIWVYALGARC